MTDIKLADQVYGYAVTHAYQLTPTEIEAFRVVEARLRDTRS